MRAALVGQHGGNVGLAAKAAATRGSRPNGLSPPLRGIEVHMDSPPTLFQLDIHGSARREFSIVMTIVASLVAPVVGLSLLVAAGCSSNKVENTKPSQDPSPAVQKPVVGRATWYGPGLYGNKTASGEILQKNTLTAAHGQLPLGTKVKVTREDTKESVIVVINDRKPFKEGTVIDLAHGAADQLGIDEEGEADVSLEVLD